MVRLNVLHCFFFLLVAQSGFASISNDVPPILPNGEWVDRIEAHGCSARTFRAFQPQSHGDLLEALLLYAESDCQGPQWLLEEREILGRSYLQSEARLFTLLAADRPLGLLGQEASVDPYQPMREGRRAYGGSQIYGELNLNSQMVSGSEWGIALSVTPGFLLAHQNTSRLFNKFYLQEGYVKLGYRRTELVVGRIPERFGEAKNGNLILSGAHKPLDMIKFEVRPHWIKHLSFLGPVTFQSWLSPDKSEQGRRNASLWALQLGMRPFTFFEFGLLNLMHIGGEGSQSLTGSQRHQSTATHLAFWGPHQDFKLYHQLFFGKLNRMENWISNDLSYLVGLWFPKVGEGDIRIEWANIRDRAYSDLHYSQGWTYSGSSLGHPLGNSSQGFYLDAGLPLIEKWRPEIFFSFEERNRSQLAGLLTETRWSSGLGAVKRFQAIEIEGQIKAQRIENRDYVRHAPEWEGGFFGFLRYSFL